MSVKVMDIYLHFGGWLLNIAINKHKNIVGGG